MLNYHLSGREEMKMPRRKKSGRIRFSSFLFFFCCMMMIAENAYAVPEAVVQQQITITGTVTDGDGEPLPGVSVMVKGATQGTATDANGAYTLTVPNENATLVFSFIGFVKQELTVGGRRTINVMLADDTLQLDEVVVVGYGTQKGSQVTSAISKIKGEELGATPFSRVDQALQGKIAGVNVQEISGRPGREFAVKVRGVSSINYSNSPLYVIDGFPVSGIEGLNTGDFESIEVLKDAAAAAIYGSRGSNGVVLITTKSGKSGKPVIQFDASYGVQKRFSKVDVMNRDEYIEFAIEERNNTWVLQGGQASDPNELRPLANYWIDPLWLTNPKSFPDHDWQDLLTRTGGVQNYQLSASGANDMVKYYISTNYFDQQGIILTTMYNRISLQSNIETKLNRFVNVGLNLSANTIYQKDPNTDEASGLIMETVRMAPILGLDQQTENDGYYTYHGGFIINPLHMSRDIENKTNRNRLLANVYADITILPDLKLRTSVGGQRYYSKSQYFIDNNVNRNRGHAGNFKTDEYVNILNENILTYNIQKDIWSLTAMGGFTYQQQYDEATDLSKTGFPDNEVHTLNVASTFSSGGSSASKWILMSYLARINFSLYDKYLLTASIRRDGSSRFGKNNKWGVFPALSAAWRVSEEQFLKSNDWISNLKIRGTYGAVGNNNIGNYAAIASLSNTNYVIGSTQTVVSGKSPGSFSNDELGWEKTMTTDIGFDLGLFNNRINLGFDYYIANTKDLLLNVPIPQITGFGTALQNIGEVQNRGVEIELTTYNLTGPFKWNTSINLSHNQNEVKKLGPDGSFIAGIANGYEVCRTEIGRPIGSYYMFVMEGIFQDENDLASHPNYQRQNPGDIKYKDSDKNGVINNDDKEFVGNNLPKWTWGFTNNFSYKNFDLSVFMDGQSGNHLLNIMGVQEGQSRHNLKGYWRNRWKSPSEPGDGKTPRAAVTANLTTVSTFFLHDASFWRIKHISLGYNLPPSLLRQVNAISSMRVYCNVDNVFMHDHYYHYPQVGTFANSALTPGIDFDMVYPLARTFTFGLSLKF